MKLIIAGTRTMFLHRDMVQDAVTMFEKTYNCKVSELVCGMAEGVDECGHDWAVANGIPVAPFPADWDRYKLMAGPIRNREMAEYADGLLLLWSGNAKTSKGSADMWRTAEKLRMKRLSIILPEM